jgi:beta-phosphoglucomutase
MIPEGILFDFDGVILDSMKYHYRAWRQVLAQYAVEVDEHYFYLQEGQGIIGVGESLLKTTDLNKNVVQKIVEEKKQLFNQIFQVEFFDGFFDCLDIVAQERIKLGIVTGGLRERIIPFVKEYLNGYFDTIITTDDVNHTKPHPEPYLTGAKNLNLDPEKCLVIENAPMGITSGKQAGMVVLAIETTLDKKYLKDADYCVASFAEMKKLLTTFLKVPLS